MEKRGAVFFEQRRPCQARCRAAFLSFARPTTEQQRNTKMMTFGDVRHGTSPQKYDRKVHLKLSND